MITVTKEEHEKLVVSAEATLMAKAWSALCDMKAGVSVSEVYQGLAVAHCSLETLEHYHTGSFDPAEYFNIISPANVVGVYSSVNTIQ